MMYLKGSKLRMDKRRRMRRTNPIFVFFLIGLIALVMYFDRFVVPEIPDLQTPTLAPTENPEALEQLGDELFAAGNIIPAIEAYEAAIMVDGANEELHISLARAQVYAGLYEAAQTSASNALLLNPNNPKALAVLGWALSFLGDDIGAEAALARALELAPDSAEANAYFAEILIEQERYLEAGDFSARALELDPFSLEARRARGYVLWYTGNYEEALTEFEFALAINENIPDIHIGLGLTYQALGEYQEAISSYSRANSLNPSDSIPETYIARIYLNLGEYTRAIQYAEDAVLDDPTNPYRHGTLGMAFFRNAEYGEAVASLSLTIHGGLWDESQIVEGIPLDYEVAHYFYFYGIALAYQRQCGDALRIAQSLMTVVPADEISYTNAEYIIDLCEDIAQEPQATSTPTPGVDPGGLDEATPEATP